MNWADRVKNCGISVEDLVALHNDRWDQWDQYIALLKNNGYEEYREAEMNAKEVKKGASELTRRFLEQLPAPWAKRWFKKGDDYVTLNAGFGSLDYTSDLDVNVISTTKEVLTLWMEFTTNFVKESTNASFCEYWDSNFYYEPGVARSLEVEPLTKVLMDENFVWTTKDTALYELACVKAYCDAYETNKNIVVDGRVSSPRPEGMTLAREQECYETALYFAEKFREAYESGTDDDKRYAYLKYAVTKIEALVSMTSLAVCNVLGDDVFHDFLNKKGKAKDIPRYVFGIAAYEMLRNLRMHSHDSEYKSKYANRLWYVLYGTPGLCPVCSRASRFKEDDTVVDVKTLTMGKSNTAILRTMTKPIAVLLDFMDDKGDYNASCPFAEQARLDPSKNKWLKNLKGTISVLCDRAFDYVEGLIKEKTSEKKKGVDYVEELIK